MATRHAHRHPDGDPDRDGHRHPHAHAHADADLDGNGEHPPEPDTHPNAAGSPRSGVRPDPAVALRQGWLDQAVSRCCSAIRMSPSTLANASDRAWPERWESPSTRAASN